MNEKIQEKINMMPINYRSNYEKAITGKSRTAAVKAFCLECVCWQRNEVKNCTSVACPLFPYRAYE